MGIREHDFRANLDVRSASSGVGVGLGYTTMATLRSAKVDADLFGF